MESIFKCPKCKSEHEKNGYYNAILHNQNMINMMMGNPKIVIDLCSKCNFVKYSKIINWSDLNE